MFLCTARGRAPLSLCAVALVSVSTACKDAPAPRPSGALEAKLMQAPASASNADLVPATSPALATQVLAATDPPPSSAAPRDARGVPELAIAARWLEALRNGNTPALAAATAFPIEFRDTRAEGHCEPSRSAADASGLAGAVECLTHDELLMGLMHEKPGVPPVETQPEGRIKPWAEAWGSEVPTGARAILSYYDRTDAWLSLILWVDARGVRAVWKTGTDVRAEVALADRWRSALRERNIDELTRLASYPFELRDEGLNAHCKKGKTAKGPEQMGVALQCLLSDKVFNEALHDSPESELEPERRTTRIPGAFPHWYRKKDHEGLWPIWTLTGTNAGYEFDLTWLIAKDGVRAFWKRGSFVEP
jgi:hypothetical protein